MAMSLPLQDVLRDVARADALQSTLVAAALGLAFHQVARSIDFEKVLFKYLAASFLSFLALPYVYARANLGGLSLGRAVAKSSLLAVAFHASLLLSIAVYRLVFHRCGKFPGPLAARVTRWYSFYLHAKEGQFHKELARLHEQYGDFVRTGMCLPFSHIWVSSSCVLLERCSPHARSTRGHGLPSLCRRRPVRPGIAMPKVGDI